MFIRYDKVRNWVVGVTAAIGGTVCAIFGFQSLNDSHNAQPVPANVVAEGEWEESAGRPGNSSVVPQKAQAATKALASAVRTPPRQKTQNPGQETAFSASALYRLAIMLANLKSDSSGQAKDVLGSSIPWKLNLYDDDRDGVWDRAKLDTNRDGVDDEKWSFKNGRWEKGNGQIVWSGDQWRKATDLVKHNDRSADPSLARYLAAMKVAMSRANVSGKAKDVLGRNSPWKLNLYDDNRDGTWDRAKLDTNRDNVDDEKWNFKNGRWEKNGGQLVWSRSNWVSPGKLASGIQKSSDPKLARYREAFKIASAKADRSGKGKDVLGRNSPWKLNLYDDNRDGVWDRAKLDTNRDEVDDEKWTFKNGRWEKSNGQLVWADGNWKSAAAIARSTNRSTNANGERYLRAMKIATSRASASGKGKDVLGSRSPWKLNLYDDDRDGIWDRAKLDTNRDDVDDEKWNFKNGRWEKNGGSKIWDGQQWIGG